MPEDEEKGEYDTRINKARPITNKRELEESSKKKSDNNKDQR